MKQELLNRFLKYISIDTKSDDASTTFPSVEKETAFAKFLVEELKAIGLQEVEMDEFSYVTATLPSNIDKEVPVIGFIAHMDTAPDMCGEVTNPLIVENYDGGDIL